MAAHSGGSPDTISRVDGQAATCDGQVVSISRKAWCTEAHGVMWEMLSPMLGLHGEGYEKSSFNLGTFVCKNRALFGALLSKAGACFEKHIYASRAALQRQDAAGSSDQVIKQDYTISTKGLLVSAVWWALAKRSGKQKELCKTVLKAWLRRVARVETDWMASLEVLVGESRARCTEGPVAQEGCIHLAGFKLGLPRALPQVPQDQLVELLCHLQQSIGTCPCLDEVYVEFLDQATCHIDELVGTFQIEAKRLQPNTPEAGSSKRRRCDPDWESYIVNEAVRLKKAKSGSQMLRSGSGAHPGSAAKWERHELLAYQQAAFRNFAACKQLAVASGGAGLGDPPGENVLFLCWSPQLDVGLVAPPQAPLALVAVNHLYD